MASVFSSLKSERTARKADRTRDEAPADNFGYIERVHDPRRRHSKPGYPSPRRRSFAALTANIFPETCHALLREGSMQRVFRRRVARNGSHQQSTATRRVATARSRTCSLSGASFGTRPPWCATPSGERKKKRLLSGLLRCPVCGRGMQCTITAKARCGSNVPLTRRAGADRTGNPTGSNSSSAP